MDPNQLFSGAKGEWMVLLQALLAVAAGGAVGWDREAVGKAAGLRTHMLICLAAMLFVDIGQFLINDAQQHVNAAILRVDPVRLIEAIVAGVSFIGAGMVFRRSREGAPEGLTTAASILSVAAIGVAIAIERYIVAAGVTFLVLIVLRLVRRLEGRISNRSAAAAEEQRK